MTSPSETPYLRAAFLAGPLVAVASTLVAGIAVVLARGLDGGIATIRTAAQIWLASIGSGITVDAVAITIVPVGALLVAVALAAAVVRCTLSDPVDDLPAFVISAAGVHALVGAVAAAAAGTGDVDISPVRAAAAAFVVGGLGAAIGATGRHGGGGALWFTISDHVRRAVRAGSWAVTVVLAAATGVVVTLLLAHLDRAGDLWALLDPGPGGGIVLAAGCLLAVPTMVLWTAAALLGPGFTLGTDTTVDLTGSQLGAVPGFPVLAALPSPGTFAGWVFLLGLVPLAAGAVAGWRADPAQHGDLRARVLAGVAGGAVGGFMLGVLIGASGGAIGPGRMVQTGPPALTPLLVAVPVMAVGGGIGAVLAHYRGFRAFRSPESGPGSGPGSGSGVGPDAAAEPGPAGGADRRPRLWQRHQPASTDRRDDQP